VVAPDARQGHCAECWELASHGQLPHALKSDTQPEHDAGMDDVAHSRAAATSVFPTAG
jgi:hypothetical protein